MDEQLIVEWARNLAPMAFLGGLILAAGARFNGRPPMAVKQQPECRARIWITRVPDYELRSFTLEFRPVTGKVWWTWVVRDEDGRSAALGHHLAATEGDVRRFAERIASRMKIEVERPGKRAERELNPGQRLAGRMLELRRWASR